MYVHLACLEYWCKKVLAMTNKENDACLCKKNVSESLIFKLWKKPIQRHSPFEIIYLSFIFISTAFYGAKTQQNVVISA